MRSAAFVDVDGTVVVTLEERAVGAIAVVGPIELRGKRIQLFVPTASITGGAARVVVANGRIGTCRSNEGIVVARMCAASIHNRGLAEVKILHGFLVTSLSL